MWKFCDEVSVTQLLKWISFIICDECCDECCDKGYDEDVVKVLWWRCEEMLWKFCFIVCCEIFCDEDVIKMLW